MNPDCLGPGVSRIEVEIDSVEGWLPGERAIEALRTELRRSAPVTA